MALLLIATPSAFFSSGMGSASTVRRPLAVRLSAADVVTAWQPAVLDSLVSTLGLQEKTYAADLDFDEFSIAGARGKVRGFEAPGKGNVAWCSALMMSDGDAVARASITAFVGPLSDVPHLQAAAAVREGGVDLHIDFKPRAECGYTPTGEYEEPSTREAFSMGGNRKDFGTAFFNEEAVAWRAALLALPGAVETPLAVEEMTARSAGPLHTCLRLPLTEEAAAAAAAACEAAVRRWLGWMEGSAANGRDLPAGAKQTAVYARDTKLRANYYVQELLPTYKSNFGEEGVGLARADAGPLDEAYVGGAS